VNRSSVTGELILGETQEISLRENQQNTELEFLEEVEELAGQPSGIILSPKDLSPFPDSTPQAILERRYKVYSDASWNGSSFNLSIVDLLLEQPNIAKALTSFRWFRGDVELLVQLTSTPKQYGAVLVANVPWFEEGFNPTHPKYDTGSIYSAQPMLLSIANQSSCHYHVPFRCPMGYIPLQGNVTTNNTIRNYRHYAEMYFDAGLTQIRRIDSSLSVTIGIQVWANFRNVQVAGVSQAQAGVYDPSSWGEYIYDTATDLASSVAPVVAEEVCSSVAPRAWCKQAISKAQTMYAQSKADETKSMLAADVAQTPWGDLSTMAPRNARFNLDCGPNVKTLDENTFGPNPDSILAIARTPSLYHFGTIGNLNVNTYFVSLAEMFGSQFYGTYLHQCSRLFRLWRGSIKYSFMFFSSPLLSTRVSFTLSWSNDNITDDPGDALIKEVTIRGDTVVNLEIPYCSPFPWNETISTGRADLNNIDTTLTLPRLVVSNTQEITRAGDVNALIPYLLYISAGDDFMFASPQAPYADFQASMVSGRITEPIAVTPERKGAKQAREKREAKEARSIAQMDVRKVFSEPFYVFGESTPEPTFLTQDPVDNIYELLARFSVRPNLSTDVLGPVAFLTTSGSDPFECETFDYISNWFLFWRGSCKYKIRLDNTTDIGFGAVQIEASSKNPIYAFNTAWIQNGKAQSEGGYWPIIDFSMPYISTHFCTFVTPPGATIYPGIVKPQYDMLPETAGGTIDTLIAAGKDYQLFYLMPPMSSKILRAEFP